VVVYELCYMGGNRQVLGVLGFVLNVSSVTRRNTGITWSQWNFPILLCTSIKFHL